VEGPSRPRPWLAVAVAETAGGCGGVAGRLMRAPWVRNASATGSSRERDGRQTGARPGCAGSVTEVGPRHGDAGNSTLPCVSVDGHGRVPEFDPARAGSNSGWRPGYRHRPEIRLNTRGRVTFPASSSTTHYSALCRGGKLSPCDSKAPRPLGRSVRGGPKSSRAVTKVRLPPEPVPPLPRTPHVLGVSSRSQPARTAMRRPGPISDGRDGREVRPSAVPPAAQYTRRLRAYVSETRAGDKGRLPPEPTLALPP
jgi:hypothetical protein